MNEDDIESVKNKLSHIHSHIKQLGDELSAVMNTAGEFKELVSSATTNAKRVYYKKKMKQSSQDLYDGLMLMKQYEALRDFYEKTVRDSTIPEVVQSESQPE